ncbi:LysR family transcriptional regulator [Falsiruegeria mediterranea]|uniref:HTH-type transcriptional regulator TrpI n=1 Tax=Falsiruegeria mediterranea M17 TaxID=1200281 RepID=A0A2R8C914_9RHOB|nr:LysR family transcriptional regulator [Falsiruegeria mediterranea]SPJ28902.1 HTH-type transcriptional regulator TrpI [Falsiruegeria mediterranea M17]
MTNRRYALPSISALIAFEAVARRKGFARAAEELNTSQPAISRHIRNLEIRFGTRLFHRDGHDVRLTPAGEGFYASALQALDGLQQAVDTVAETAPEVTLASSHAVSHLLLMPRYRDLRRALGKGVELRFLTAEYHLIGAAIETGADIVFEYARTAPNRDHVLICREEVKPVGTPEVIAQAMAALKNEAAPPGLLELQQKNLGWTTWARWQAAHPETAGWTECDAHDNYVYLLEMAASGAGLALGWRGFVGGYLDRGALVGLPGDWFATDVGIYARLTRNGERNDKAQACLAALKTLSDI